MKKILAIAMLLAFIICSIPALAAQRSEWLSPYQYYYYQLSAEHRAAWENDINNTMAYPNQVKMMKDRRQQALACMIKSDNPRIFWIDWIDSNAMLRFDTGSEPHYGGVQIPGGKTLADYQAVFTAAVDAAVADVRAKLPANADAQTTMRVIYDWLCANNTYNDYQTSKYKKDHDPVSFDYLIAHSAYSAIIPGDEYEPVCEGYAGAFKLLCDELGVQCICVSGSMTSLNMHMWNYVRMEDGSWYQVDVTTGDAYATDIFCMMNSAIAAKYEYTPNPYMGSGVNPGNGYTEGAAFVVPPLAD